MKIMIASDIHGSARYCREMLEAFDREAADKLLLLGDILYHGPRNDLPEAYAPKTVIELLNDRKDKILCVRGNGPDGIKVSDFGGLLYTLCGRANDICHSRSSF